MAETTLLPVRGARRFEVTALLTASAMATAASVGALAGLLGGLAGPLPAAAVAGVALAVVAADVTYARIGRPRPLAVHRQVPQAWSRLFSPGTVAVLYGARLGVGPLTILTTWCWWGSFVLAASAGPWAGALCGATFAAARVAVTLVAGWGVTSGDAMARRVQGLRRLERLTGSVAGMGVVLVASALVLASCSGDDGGATVAPSTDSAAGATTTSTSDVAPSPTVDSGAGTVPTGIDASSTTVVTDPAVDLLPDLEPSEQVALTVDDPADLIPPDALPGFTLLPEGQLGSGPLDLEAAAAAEPDVEAERALLETRGYVDGYARAWSGPGGSTAVVVAYHFDEPDGAAAYLVDGAEHALARAGQPFVVDGVEGAFGITQVDESGSAPFVTHAVVMVRGPAFLLVLVGSTDGSQDVDAARTLARLVDAHVAALAAEG